MGDEHIAARTVLWAAGVTGSRLGRSLGVPLDRANRVIVNPDLTVPGHPEAYVIGDLASLMQDGSLVPGVAPAAMQEGRHAVKNILRSIRGEPLLPFHYHDKGSLATIGRKAAVAQMGPLKLSGLIAWVAWLGIHIMFLIGFRNRFLVMFQWAWSFFSYDRGARLITGPIRRDGDLLTKRTGRTRPIAADEAVAGPAARAGDSPDFCSGTVPIFAESSQQKWDCPPRPRNGIASIRHAQSRARKTGTLFPPESAFSSIGPHEPATHAPLR